jgi:DNA-binding transcriptional ArsR family regulator
VNTENLKSSGIGKVGVEHNQMSISPVKRLILETMWVLDKPAKATEIAKDTGVSFPSVMMHIIGLTRLGFAISSEKGFYAITDKGKKSLGLPEVTKERATEILAYLPVDKSFHFYADYGKPLDVHAASLQDFCQKITTLNISSIEFHNNRGDFEAWFNTLGDAELARKTLLIREQKMTGEELRNKLLNTVKNRCEELAKVKNQPSFST